MKRQVVNFKTNLDPLTKRSRMIILQKNLTKQDSMKGLVKQKVNYVYLTIPEYNKTCFQKIILSRILFIDEPKFITN